MEKNPKNICWAITLVLLLLIHFGLALNFLFAANSLEGFADENGKSRTGTTGADILQRGSWAVAMLSTTPYMIYTTFKGTRNEKQIALFPALFYHLL